MKDFYEQYRGLHEEVIGACDCIESNNSSKLREEVETIKSSIDRISVSNWQDSVGDKFKNNKESCSTKLNNILASIDSVFSKSEEIYHLLKAQLDNLKSVNDNYRSVYLQEPKMSEERKPIYQENEDGNKVFLRYDYSNYYNKLNKWKDSIKKIKEQCEICIDNIEKYLTSLSQIDGMLITAEASSVLLMGSIPELFIPSIVSFSSIQMANNIVNYKFNSSTYRVIDTKGIDYQNIPKKSGKQKPDKCLAWSGYYATDIFENSDSIPADGDYIVQGLTSSDKQEILQIMAKEILEGRPSIIQVTGLSKGGDTYSRHFVTVAGIKEDADLSNLKESDFLIMDPTLAGLKPLDTKYSEHTTRSLLKCEDATYRASAENQGYGVLVYNNPEIYESESCKITKI